LSINQEIEDNMLQSDKDALHFDVIANTAHKVEIVAKDLANMHRESIANTERIKRKKEHLCKYFNELNSLLQTI
jgi:hypothetical protein